MRTLIIALIVLVLYVLGAALFVYYERKQENQFGIDVKIGQTLNERKQIVPEIGNTVYRTDDKSFFVMG